MLWDATICQDISKWTEVVSSTRIMGTEDGNQGLMTEGVRLVRKVNSVYCSNYIKGKGCDEGSKC